MNTTRLAPRLAVPLLAAAILTVASTGTGYAYWRTSGSGSGTAATGTLAVEVVAVVAPEGPTGTLLPGRTADAVVKVHNPNPTAVTVTDVVILPGAAITASNNCAPTGVVFTDQHAVGAVIAPDQTQLVNLPGSVAMSTASASTCQGASFSIPVTVTVRQ